MEQATEILVIINSVVLIAFLILGLVVLVQLLLLLKHVRRLIAKAEDVASTVEAISSALKSAAGPVSVGGFVGNILRTFMKEGKRGKKK